MKKSELTIIGEYRLAPEAWGNETMVMIDEKKAQKAMADCFGCSLPKCDPDGYENDIPKWIELARDNNNNYYVVYSGINDQLFQLCEDIPKSNATGMLRTLGYCEPFEDETTIIQKDLVNCCDAPRIKDLSQGLSDLRHFFLHPV